MNNEMMFFVRYYIETRDDGAITAGFSDFAEPHRDTSNAILLTDRGEGTQFRLEPGGEENPWPLMFDAETGIPLLKWNGKKIVPRTKAEIQAERDTIVNQPQLPTMEERVSTIESVLIDVVIESNMNTKNVARLFGHQVAFGKIDIQDIPIAGIQESIRGL